MKLYLLLIISIFISSCSHDKSTLSDTKQEIIHEERVEKSEFQAIIDSAGVEGSILIYDFQKHD